MSVRKTDNTPALVLDKGNRVSLAIRFMLDGVQKLSEPKTPKKHGNLRADVIKPVKVTQQGTVGVIVWDKNYAAVQEAGKINGKAIQNYTTPGTGPHFAQNAVKQVMKDAQTYFKKAGL